MGDKHADADDGDRQIEMWKIKRVRAEVVDAMSSQAEANGILFGANICQTQCATCASISDRTACISTRLHGPRCAMNLGSILTNS